MICVWEQNESSHVVVDPDKFRDGTTEAVAVHIPAKISQRIDLNQKEEPGNGGKMIYFVRCVDYEYEVLDRGSRGIQTPSLLRSIATLPNIDV